MKFSTEVKVGIIMTITIAVFVWLFNYMKGLNFLKPVISYYVVYDQINGLHESNPVYLNGYKIGLVNNIEFLPDLSGSLIVKLTLDKPFNIPVDSKAQIYSADLMGTQAIRIRLGHAQNYFSSGDTLRGEVEGSLQEQVSAQILPVKVKAENLLSSIDSVMAVIQYTFNKDFRNNFNRSFQDIRSSLIHLEHSTYAVDTFITKDNSQFATVVNNIEDITYALKGSLNKLDYVLDNVSELSDSLTEADINTTINNLNITLARTSELLHGINEGKGTLGQLAMNDSLYISFQKLTMRLDTLVNRITENPKKYIRVKIF